MVPLNTRGVEVGERRTEPGVGHMPIILAFRESPFQGSLIYILSSNIKGQDNIKTPISNNKMGPGDCSVDKA